MYLRILMAAGLILFGPAAPPMAAQDAPRHLCFRLQLKSLVPAEVTVAPGQYDIAVINSVVNGSLTMRLGVAKPGAAVADVSAGVVNETPREHDLSSRHLVKLTPGRFLLTLGDNPNWTAVINVVVHP